MGNMNSSAFRRISLQYGIPCQLELGKDPRSTKGLHIGGYYVNGCSNWTVDMIDDFFAKAKKDGIHEAVQSVCKQKVNTAHGRTRMEQARHAGSQNGTYANRFEQVQLYKRNLYDVFCMYCMLDTDVKFEFHKDYDYKSFARSYINVNYGNKELKIDDIKNNYIIVDDKVVAINNLIYVIDQWIKENKIQKEFSREEKIKAIRAFERERELQAV
jgi:hypothetical protein